MPIIVESQPITAETFASAVSRKCEVVMNLEELKARLAGDEREFAIILGSGVDLEAAASLADTLRVTRPAMSVILIRRRVDTQVLAEALRSGMREVVEERDLTGLGAAVERASGLWDAMHGSVEGAGHGKLVTVFSPKGGVGKTTMAVNTALALVDGGKNRVCLVDLDLAFGDVAITLQLFPSRTLADAIAMEAGLDFVSLETLLTQHKDGLYMLAAPVQPDARDSITPSLVGKVLRLLKANFDYVVVDTAPSFDEHVLQAIDETDELLLVTTLDVPTLKNVKIAAETLDLLNFPKPQRRLVLNRADEKVGLEPEKVASTLAMAIAAAIPNSPQVPNQTNAGEPIVAAQPRHPVSRAITALAFEIQGLGDRHVDQDSKPARNGSPRRTLLRRNAR